jgi:hypothetical protein
MENTASLFFACGSKTTGAREKLQIFLIKPKNSHLGLFNTASLFFAYGSKTTGA